MNNEELPSDSDSSDDDFVPDGAEKELSEESDGKCVESGDEDNSEKRKKSTGRKGRARKKLKPLEEKENEEKQEPATSLTVEEKKKRSDAIWADFLKDCGPPAKKQVTIETDATSDGSERNNEELSGVKAQASSTKQLPDPPVKKVTQLFEFAGEKVEVESEVSAESDAQLNGRSQSGLGARKPVGPGKSGCAGGIAGILGQLGKKGKLSTLEKSKLDWEKFKKEENISEDLQRFNKGKMGYLERQEFLERADLRQFELEKDLRTKKRSLNR